MPYIETKTSASVSGEQIKALKEMFAEVIEIIPGKSEEWLMLNTIGDCRMSFRGDMDTPCAMIKVEIFGKEVGVGIVFTAVDNCIGTAGKLHVILDKLRDLCLGDTGGIQLIFYTIIHSVGDV